MKSFIRLFIMFIVAVTIGCSVDLTKGYVGDAPKCSLHYIQMHPERIRVSGECVYVLKYCELARRTFPYHGGHRYNFETENTPRERDVEDWVCPECHREYTAYWKDRAFDQRMQPTD